VLVGCDPRFAEGSTVLTRDLDENDTVAVRRNGDPLLNRAVVESALPEEGANLVRVIAYDTTADETLAVLVLSQGETALAQILQLWREGELVRSLVVASKPRQSISRPSDLGLSGRTVQISPTGAEVAVGSLLDGAWVTLFDVSSGRNVLLPSQHGIDWSPDGTWLAVSAAEDVLVLGAERSVEVFRLPVAAAALSWVS
jgi:hypothetical protein